MNGSVRPLISRQAYPSATTLPPPLSLTPNTAPDTTDARSMLLYQGAVKVPTFCRPGPWLPQNKRHPGTGESQEIWVKTARTLFYITDEPKSQPFAFQPTPSQRAAQKPKDWKGDHSSGKEKEARHQIPLPLSPQSTPDTTWAGMGGTTSRANF